MVKPEDKTILVVEDEPDVRVFLQTVLEDAGFRVLTAEDGEIAWKLINEKRPDLISLDLVLPKMSGHKILHALKKDEELSKIPVLIVTAHADDDLGKVKVEGETDSILESIWRPKSLNQGPGVFLRKPVRPIDYAASVEAALGIEPSDELKERLANRGELDALAQKAPSHALKTALESLRKCL
jgi:CheY-like chemotaxis protein